MRRHLIWQLPLLALLAFSGPAVEKIVPNDPLFEFQFSFDNPGGKLTIPSYSYKSAAKDYEAVKGIDPDLLHAWAVTTGKKDVVVAVLDDGFFYNHEDIKDNIWKNPGESGPDKDGYPKETNGIDDDENGYVDDVIGWDFAFDDPDPGSYVFDGMDATRIQPYWHSISALGIIGAGNSAKNVDLKENYSYPSCFENDNILNVAEIDFKGDLFRYKIEDKIWGSNYGEKNVDIAAIGMNYTTFLKDNRSVYALPGGTSNSTPVVAGVAALVLSVRPELRAPELKRILMDSVTPLPALKGKIGSAGMVNAYQALQLARRPKPCPHVFPDLFSFPGGSPGDFHLFQPRPGYPDRLTVVSDAP